MLRALVEIQKKFAAKRDQLAAIFDEAKTDDGYDFEKITSLEGDTIAKAEAISALNDELNDLGEQAETLQKADKARENLDRIDALKAGMPHQEPTNGADPSLGNLPVLLQSKGMGTLFVESGAYAAFKDGGRINVPALVDYDLKTLFQTTAGWAPESLRIGRVIDAVTRPIQVTDLIPPGATTNAAIVYMLETTRTHAAAETAEGAVYPESTFVLTQQTNTVRKIGDSVPVTDEQLDDVAQAESYLNQRLAFGVRQRLDGQILTGDGIAPNLEGILNVTGIQTQAKAADPVFDAVHKALTKIRVTGRANPTGLIFHHNDWEGVRLTRTADGIYILGNPADPGELRLWGLPVALSDAITENTALAGDFATFSQLYERRGLEVQVGFINDDFTRGQQHIRADMRVALVVYRPAAFATITGI